MKKSDLAIRMKKYESITKNYLLRKTPAIIRLDGKAFHTFTRGFDKPFDELLTKTMQATMLHLCKNIQGCVLGYTQSDEITLVLCDYQTLSTDAWFGYNVQKMVGVSASMATRMFNKNFRELLDKHYRVSKECCIANTGNSEKADLKYSKYFKKLDEAEFDSRVFSLPIEEVNNCLLWRQQDATTNSILTVAQSNFSHREVEGKSCNELQDKLFLEKGINWNNTPTHLKRGTCCIRKPTEIKPDVTRLKWFVDLEPPIFSANKDYVNSLIIFE